MSIEVMSRVWKYSRARSGCLLVLLAIADHADDEGQAYPSIVGIGHKSRLKARQVHNAVKWLVESGELSVDYKMGPGGKNLYTVHMEELKKQTHPKPTLQNLHSAMECREDPAIDCTVQSIAPKPSIKRSSNRQPFNHQGIKSPPNPPLPGGAPVLAHGNETTDTSQAEVTKIVNQFIGAHAIEPQQRGGRQAHANADGEIEDDERLARARERKATLRAQAEALRRAHE